MDGLLGQISFEEDPDEHAKNGTSRSSSATGWLYSALIPRTIVTAPNRSIENNHAIDQTRRLSPNILFGLGKHYSWHFHLTFVLYEYDEWKYLKMNCAFSRAESQVWVLACIYFIGKKIYMVTIPVYLHSSTFYIRLRQWKMKKL
jgi:hypothetical protein